VEDKMDTPQQNADRLKQSFADDLRIYDKYIGKQVAIEEGETGVHISTATLIQHGSQTLDLLDYVYWDVSIESITGRLNSPHPYLNKDKVLPRYKLPRRAILKSQVASIQLLEDLLQGTKQEDIFEKN